MRYNAEELDRAAIKDLLADAKAAREQAIAGPYYPERGITRDSLLAYAGHCEATAAMYRNGGAHNAVLSGKV